MFADGEEADLRRLIGRFEVLRKLVEAAAQARVIAVHCESNNGRIIVCGPLPQVCDCGVVMLVSYGDCSDAMVVGER